MIGHVDADCFYVSAERVRFPHLTGVPVGVIGNHGACIIAKSYEAKAAGIKTGTPIWEGVTLCPDAVYVKRDFRWYEALSRKMLELVKEVSPRVEFYSIDESFYEVEVIDPHGLQAAILERVGVPVSVGIAPTKTLAKLCSDSSKPFGVRIVTSDDERRELLAGIPVTEVCGIAGKAAIKLAAHRITTCDEFVAADNRLIRKLLTVVGERLWYELRGEPVLPVLISRAAHQRIARGGSIGRATRDPARVAAFVVRNVERVVEALFYYQVTCDQLTLSLDFRGAPGRAIRCSLLGSTADTGDLRDAALWLLPRVWRPASATVHYMHVIADRLRPLTDRQRSLFERRTVKDERIEFVKRSINDVVGRFALRSASTLPLTDVYDDPANSYDIPDIHGKTCF
ncbi:DNA polymerase Y family protein [Lacipirellula parvula]|uniref:DNA polymerase V n=1 Tax=Lacipirellula parvula TaxID=2650471 RepID=A0A5K7XAA0_9BACT|nr:nucleotidyltransferase [Lacipirellula parvula]BBO33630.1 DNA polymerase V [Lacipirellula parvula]